ncbi:3-deoxy-7-phosphoheptulonate synthase [Striga asiatica]|uniref:3-deoxy-7-phosphoheptulonate synthase n=1 Tax=Striga asiatica TaxID=4170 RepID=A0A5A7P951_STRAF|nr:3-deoxy-7-phosphoheptulonate synthase [Striga asiatica]
MRNSRLSWGWKRVVMGGALVAEEWKRFDNGLKERVEIVKQRSLDAEERNMANISLLQSVHSICNFETTFQLTDINSAIKIPGAESCRGTGFGDSGLKAARAAVRFRGLRQRERQ